MKEKSCGTVLYTVKDNVIHYLLIKATDTYCGFPKGHVEAGETVPVLGVGLALIVISFISDAIARRRES